MVGRWINMKQNITIKQINELTDIGGNELWNIWFNWLIAKKYLTENQAEDAMSNLPYAVNNDGRTYFEVLENRLDCSVHGNSSDEERR